MARIDRIPLYVRRRIEKRRANRSKASKDFARDKRREEHKELTARAKFRRIRSREDMKRYMEEFGVFSYARILHRWLPTNIAYITSEPKSDFYINFETVRIKSRSSRTTFKVPAVFSLIDNAEESYRFIKNIIVALLCESFDVFVLDYHHCKSLNIGAQVLLDVILKDIFEFYKKCTHHPKVQKKVEITKIRIEIFRPESMPDFVKKILYSVGSFAIHRNKSEHFPDIIPYELCIHSREGQFDRVRAIERKDIDTTTLADYVINSLAKMNKRLTPEKREDLCVVIGEALINAEEHASTKHRFSIGYFQDVRQEDKHVGFFRLVILNFGRTIYEKFADLDCGNPRIVGEMKKLSAQYTQRRLFSEAEFNEETLWTLYALQEGVTSVAETKRGHGSIQFMDSFFNLNGDHNFIDDRSRMTIMSGQTKIILDGKYKIIQKKKGGEKWKVMTFNKSGEITDKPDKEKVRSVTNYFPGTLISAKIIFDEEDFAI